jgi:hypothetical protein
MKSLENICNPLSTNFHSRSKCTLNMPRILQWAYNVVLGSHMTNYTSEIIMMMIGIHAEI